MATIKNPHSTLGKYYTTQPSRLLISYLEKCEGIVLWHAVRMPLNVIEGGAAAKHVYL